MYSGGAKNKYIFICNKIINEINKEGQINSTSHFIYTYARCKYKKIRAVKRIFMCILILLPFHLSFIKKNLQIHTFSTILHILYYHQQVCHMDFDCTKHQTHLLYICILPNVLLRYRRISISFPPS